MSHRKPFPKGPYGPVPKPESENEEQWVVRNPREEASDRMNKAILEVLDSNMARLDKIQDPMSRNLAFLDKLMTAMDTLTIVLKTNLDLQDKETQDKMDQVSQRFKKHTEGLMEWIQQPCYAPNHPVGQGLMNGARKDWEERLEKQ